MRFDLAVKWGPAWLDQPAEDPDNYDHSCYESVTLEEAADLIRSHQERFIEATLTLSEGTEQ